MEKLLNREVVLSVLLQVSPCRVKGCKVMNNKKISADHLCTFSLEVERKSLRFAAVKV